MMEAVENPQAGVIVNQLSRIGKQFMRVKIRGINRIRRKLASGEEVIYYYHRETGIRLSGKPDSPEFVSSYAHAEESLRARHSDGTLSASFENMSKAFAGAIVQRIPPRPSIGAFSVFGKNCMGLARARDWRMMRFCMR